MENSSTHRKNEISIFFNVDIFIPIKPRDKSKLQVCLSKMGQIKITLAKALSFFLLVHKVRWKNFPEMFDHKPKVLRLGSIAF